VTLWLVVLAWAVASVRGRRRLVRVARAGHEARGPLCTARLALEGLERSARVEAIDLELRRAALALDDLAGRPRERVTTVDVGRLLSEAAPAWHALAEAHGTKLVIEPGEARVTGDRLRLAQACGNLVANAIEHGAAPDDSSRSDAVALVAVRSWSAGGRVRVEVRDRGPGLPAPVTELVAAARGRRSPRGHGLAIAAAVADRHGGRLSSAPAERGAHLVLELPAAS
jgi:signal transduction histidine kinase